jgi:hypothetical protein
VKVRLLALGLAVWVAAYAWLYVVGMRDQGSTPYWWYVAIIGAGAAPPVLAAAGLRSRSLLICGAVVLGIAAVLALPSIGMLLVPAVITAAAVAFLSPRRALRLQAQAAVSAPAQRDRRAINGPLAGSAAASRGSSRTTD